MDYINFTEGEEIDVQKLLEQKPIHYIRELEENFKRVCKNLQEEEIKRKKLEIKIQNVQKQMQNIQQNQEYQDQEKINSKQSQSQLNYSKSNLLNKKTSSYYNNCIHNINAKYQGLTSRTIKSQKVNDQSNYKGNHIMAENIRDFQKQQQQQSQQDYQSSQLKVTQLQRKNIALYNENINLTAKIESLQNEIQSLKSQLSKKDVISKVQNENLKEQMKVTKTQCQQLQLQIRDVSKQNEKLQKKNLKINELRNLNQNLEIKNKQLQQKHDNLSRQKISKSTERIKTSYQNKSQDNIKVKANNSFSKRKNTDNFFDQIQPVFQKIQNFQNQINEKDQEILELKQSVVTLEKVVSDSKRKSNKYKKVILTLRAKNPQEQIENQREDQCLNHEVTITHPYSVTPSSDQDLIISPNHRSSTYLNSQSSQQLIEDNKINCHSSNQFYKSETEDQLQPQTSQNQINKIVSLSIPTIDTENLQYKEQESLNKTFGNQSYTAKLYREAQDIKKEDLNMKYEHDNLEQDEETLTLDDLKKLLVSEENKLQLMQQQSEDAINKSMQVVKGFQISLDHI